MNNGSKISICGDVCSECPRYIATKNNDLSDLKKIADLWYRLGLRDKILNPEELKCSGCSRDKFCSYDIISCKHLESIDNCGECDCFPCDKINSVFRKTDITNDICKSRCSDDEYKRLNRAFLMKRQILTEISENYKRNK